MPNIKSAKKRVLVSEARNERNRSYRSALRTSIKRAFPLSFTNSKTRQAVYP